MTNSVQQQADIEIFDGPRIRLMDRNDQVNYSVFSRVDSMRVGLVEEVLCRNSTSSFSDAFMDAIWLKDGTT